MTALQSILDTYADGTPARSLAESVRSLSCWTGDDPRLLVAETAASTTGQRFLGGVKPSVERFSEAFVATDRVQSLAAIAALDPDDADLITAFGAERKRHVLVETAAVLADRPEADDLDALQAWAATADHYRYETDPIGTISGIGPSSFQLLRQLAGIETARPHPTVRAFVDTLAADIAETPLSTTTPLRTIASCEWLAFQTTYTPLEIDRLAWWIGTDADERSAIADRHGISINRCE